MFERYILDPSSSIAPSLAIQAALLKCKKKFDFLTKIDVITEIESSNREGLKTVVHGKITFNNETLSDYDNTKVITSRMLGAALYIYWLRYYQLESMMNLNLKKATLCCSIPI